MGTVNYIKGLYGPVRVRYPLGLSPSGIIDPTTGLALPTTAVIGGAGYSTTYPEISSLASARFLEWNLKTTNTGSGEVYGDYMSLQSAGTGTGYVYTKGALAKSVAGGYVAELGACYYKTQLTAGTVTGQAYSGFFEYVVDTGVANMPSGGCIQLDDIVDGSLNAVHGYIAIRTYGGTPFSNLFNIMDHTTGTGKLFYGCTLKNRIGSTLYYIPLSTVENTFTFSGALTLAGAISVDDTTDTTSGVTGSIHTDGGLGIAKNLWVAVNANVIGTLGVGANAAGTDFTVYGAVTAYKTWWDANGDTNGAWYFGADTKGVQVNLYGDVTGCGVFWDPTTDTNGTLSIGATGGSKGNDVFMYGATNGNYVQWDQSADDLLLVGTATQLAVAGTTASTTTTTGSLRTAGGLGVVGAAFFGGLVTSSSTTGFRSLPVFVPDSTRTNYALAIGSRITELDVTMAASTSQHLDPVQMNLNIIGSAPTSTSTVNGYFMQITHDTTAMTGYLRLKGCDWTMTINKNLQDAYVFQGEVDFTGNTTVGGEAAGFGITMTTAATSVVTGNVWGGVIATDFTSAVSIGAGLFLSHRTGTLTHSLYVEANTGATITDAIYINPAGTVTNALNIASLNGNCAQAYNAVGTAAYSIKCKINNVTTYIHTYDAP